MDDEMQIKLWIREPWYKKSADLFWKNIDGYHIAVGRDPDNHGRWRARIRLENSQFDEFVVNDCMSKRDAQNTVLRKLLEIRACD